MYRAVIVDDEPFMLEGMRLMIDWAACGFELCGEASSAEAALHLLDTLSPHLLITDVRMPGMQGTDLASIVNHYHPNVIILFFSGFKEFSYARSAIRSNAFGYLVKPIETEEVHDTLRRVKIELDARALREQTGGPRAVILRDQLLRRIALGDDTSETLMRAGVLIGLAPNDPCYCAVLTGEHDSVPENTAFTLAACSAVVFQLSSGQYGLGFQQIERDLPMLERLLSSVGETPPLQLSAGRVHRGMKGFAKSLREALDAQGVLFMPHNTLRLYRAFEPDTAAWLSQVRPVVLYKAMTDVRPETLDEALHTLAGASAAGKPSLFSLRLMAASLDALMTGESTSPEGGALRAMWQTETLDREAWVEAFSRRLRQLRGELCQTAASELPAPVQTALAFIAARYAQPISINSVADELHMNPAYLGQLVRRHTGATFHCRLLNTRIEHACLLLRQTARPVLEIAMEVGFRDVDYFSRQFRGRMGMSPVTYRYGEGGYTDDSQARQ